MKKKQKQVDMVQQISPKVGLGSNALRLASTTFLEDNQLYVLVGRFYWPLDQKLINAKLA